MTKETDRLNILLKKHLQQRKKIRVPHELKLTYTQVNQLLELDKLNARTYIN